MTIPTSLADAEERRQQITLEIQGIQAQLGDKQRTDESGHRLDAQEYWAWKKRAQHALNQKLDELRTLKAWIKEHRPPYEEPVRTTPRTQEIVGQLADLHGILVELQTEEVEFEPDELNKIAAAQRTLSEFGLSRVVDSEP